MAIINLPANATQNYLYQKTPVSSASDISIGFEVNITRDSMHWAAQVLLGVFLLDKIGNPLSIENILSQAKSPGKSGGIYNSADYMPSSFVGSGIGNYIKAAVFFDNTGSSNQPGNGMPASNIPVPPPTGPDGPSYIFVRNKVGKTLAQKELPFLLVGTNEVGYNSVIQFIVIFSDNCNRIRVKYRKPNQPLFVTCMDVYLNQLDPISYPPTTNISNEIYSVISITWPTIEDTVAIPPNAYIRKLSSQSTPIDTSILSLNVEAPNNFI